VTVIELSRGGGADVPRGQPAIATVSRPRVLGTAGRCPTILPHPRAFPRLNEALAMQCVCYLVKCAPRRNDLRGRRFGAAGSAAVRTS
jgi:hypothetical protein